MEECFGGVLRGITLISFRQHGWLLRFLFGPAPAGRHNVGVDDRAASVLEVSALGARPHLLPVSQGIHGGRDSGQYVAPLLRLRSTALLAPLERRDLALHGCHALLKVRDLRLYLPDAAGLPLTLVIERLGIHLLLPCHPLRVQVERPHAVLRHVRCQGSLLWSSDVADQSADSPQPLAEVRLCIDEGGPGSCTGVASIADGAGA